MSEWTTDEDAMLRNLFAEGKSYSQIGAAVGRTKNAAISRARKLKLGSRGDLHFIRMAARSAKVRKKKTRSQPRRQKMETLVVRDVPVFLDETRLASIVDVTGCKWPVREDAAFVGGHALCNHPVDDLKSYCPYHVGLSRSKVQPKPILSLGPLGLRFGKRAA